MANSAHNYLFPASRFPVSGETLRDFGGYKAAVALGIVGAGLTALFFYEHWSVALVGSLVVLVLSFAESEPFLLLIMFLMPIGWYLMAGGAGHDVLSAVRNLVVLGFFLSRLWRRRIQVGRLLHSPVARASLYLLGAATLSIVLTRGGWTYYSTSSLYKLVSYVGFFFLVLAWADSPERIRKILSMLLYSTIITAIFGIFQTAIGGYTSFWLYLYSTNEYSRDWEGRPSSFLSYTINLAGYLNLVLPFALACYTLGQGKWKTLGRWTLGLGFLALVTTQSVGGLVAFAAILVLGALCFAGSLKKRLAVLVGIAAAACLLYILRDVLNPYHTEQGVISEGMGRLLLWGTAWEYFLHSPILGVGWGNFVGLYGYDVNSILPPGQLEVHNLYLQFLSETGLVGLVAFFYLVVQSWQQAWRQWHSPVSPLGRMLAFGVLGALLSVLVHGCVDFLFQVSPQFGTLFWLLLALLVANGWVQCKSTARSKGLA